MDSYDSHDIHANSWNAASSITSFHSLATCTWFRGCKSSHSYHESFLGWNFSWHPIHFGVRHSNQVLSSPLGSVTVTYKPEIELPKVRNSLPAPRETTPGWASFVSLAKTPRTVRQLLKPGVWNNNVFGHPRRVTRLFTEVDTWWSQNWTIRSFDGTATGGHVSQRPKMLGKLASQKSVEYFRTGESLIRETPVVWIVND